MAVSKISALAVAALVLALMALSGCTLKDQDDQPISATDMLSQQPLTVPKYVDPSEQICREIPGNKPCYCMTCTNTSSYTGPLKWLLSGFFDSTLSGGTCGVYPCNKTDYETIVSDSKDTQMRAFALGAGQSFASTGIANLYCNYSLQFATKWMKGSKGSPPRVPLASRASCWLDRNTLPIYIYYTGGEEISPARTGEIAQAFNSAGTGPVILTTEAGWDGTNTVQAGLVKQQVLAIDSCDKCMTVLAVRLNDYQALYNVMGVPGNLDYGIYDKIDAVGFGFRANDYPTCNKDQAIFEAINFSRYILQKYNKPTIWLYVGVSEGNSSAGGEGVMGGCNWTQENVQDFYSSLMARTGGLGSAGVLGMSAYEFVDRTGPIPCNGVQGCDFGMLLANGSQKHPGLNSWADMCQEVNMRSMTRKPLIFSRNGQGYVCDTSELGYYDQALMYEAARIASSQGLMDGPVWAQMKVKNLGCGEVCPGNGSAMPKPSTYDGTSNSFDAKHCSIYPVIDERADDLDISATYLRAEFEQESGFDPMAVSPCVDITLANGQHNNKCNPMDYTMAQICELAGNPAGCKSSLACPAGKKPCAYGLAQCIEYPGKAYTPDNPYGQVQGGIPGAIAGCGGENYNPFDAGQSACCGAGKFATFLRDGSGTTTEKFVQNNWAELSKCQPDGMTEEERGWAAYYLASNRYLGATWNVLSEFVSQRDSNGACTGTKHYIDYLRSNATKDDDTKYGAQVMSRYRAAADKCDSDCPK